MIVEDQANFWNKPEKSHFSAVSHDLIAFVTHQDLPTIVDSVDCQDYKHREIPRWTKQLRTGNGDVGKYFLEKKA